MTLITKRIKMLYENNVKKKVIFIPVLTSLLFITVNQTFLVRNEEKLVALLVYSSIIEVSTSGFRINPRSRKLVEMCPQMRINPESVRIHRSTAERHSKSSVGYVTTLVPTEHVRNKYSLRESIHLKSVTGLIASIYWHVLNKLHILLSTTVR